MANFNSYWCHMIISLFIILICTDKSASQFVQVSCYECTNCTDPFVNTSSNVAILSSCNTCYKMAITMAFAPYSYVIRRCVPACLETSQTFGGGSAVTTCCATTLCNTSSIVTFSPIFLFIFLCLSFIKTF